MIPFLYEAFLTLSGFWGFRNPVLSGSFFKAGGRPVWLPLDHLHWCLSFFSFLSWWAGHGACLPAWGDCRVSSYPWWLRAEKENKQLKLPLKPSRLGQIVLILLVPGFKVHFTFYGGDQPSQGAGLRGPASEPGGQLTVLTSSFLPSPYWLSLR